LDAREPLVSGAAGTSERISLRRSVCNNEATGVAQPILAARRESILETVLAILLRLVKAAP
jgi:hypothetical protein